MTSFFFVLFNVRADEGIGPYSADNPVGADAHIRPKPYRSFMLQYTPPLSKTSSRA